MRVTPLIASTFLSDGGTMFGLVPKAIWARRIVPDEHNRIPQHAHVLLVELEDGRCGLVDTGCGSADRFSEKEQRLHGLGPGWPLGEALANFAKSPEDIAFVIYTHLHWDHAGGAYAFPHAEHVIHEVEWQDATSGDPLLYKSYPAEVLAPLRGLKKRLVSAGESEVLPGIWMHRTSGHTRGHCAIRLMHPRLHINHLCAERFRGVTQALFCGDVCPMHHNLRMVFQTSYDTYPLDTRAWKRAWLPRAANERILLLFDHDPDLYGATIREDSREEFVVAETLPASG